jgi:hypothetical protein
MNSVSRCGWLVALAAIGIGPVVLAEGPAEVIAPEGAQPREAAGRPDAGAEAGQRYLELVRHLEGELADRLGLDDEQRAELKEVIADHVEGVRERTSAAVDNRDKQARAQELMADLREARESGDREKINKVREEIASLRRNRFEPMQAATELFEQIKPIATEEQIPKLEEFQRQFVSRLGGGDVLGQTMRRMRMAIQGLELSDEQRNRVRDIFSKSYRDAREAAGDAEAADRLAASIREEITGVLDEDQTTQFEAKLTELEQADKQREAPQGRPKAPTDTGGRRPARGQQPGAGSEPQSGEPQPGQGSSTESGGGHSEPE